MKRVLIYAHKDPHGKLDAHVRYQLNELKNIFDKIIFVSISPLDSEAISFLESIVQTVMKYGKDSLYFNAWRSGILQVGKEELQSYDEVVLMNDGLYGPFFPIAEMYNVMATVGADYWGLFRNSASEDEAAPESCLIALRPQAFLSPVFWNFWLQPFNASTTGKIGPKTEPDLANTLKEAGFISAAYSDMPPLPYTPATGIAVPLHLTAAPLLITNYRTPFILISTFATAQGKQYNLGAEVYDALDDAGSNYPVELITEHLGRTRPLSWSKNQPGFLNVLRSDGEIPPNPAIRIAVYLHMYYEHLFGIALNSLRNIPYPFDLYISTTSESKKQQIEENVAGASLPNIRHAEVRAFENRGRDVAPWLLGFKDVQTSYDVALKLHFKSRVAYNEEYSRQWQRFILKCTLESPCYVGEIIHLFMRRPNLGLAFHPYPPALLLHGHHNFVGGHLAFMPYGKALGKCGLKACQETSYPVFPTNIFWYRPKSLISLFQGNIVLEDFPPEPCPDEGTIAHGLERAIPSIAHAQGWECALVIPDKLLIETFQHYEDHILHMEHAGWGIGAPNVAMETW